ncbi:MAG TPA: hypothetical protein DEV73_01775 [Candidatus Zambryskibacteria bacterium]|uniref:Uncharacterized protein n=1 Tax=Candidatus Nomurabacteria bacterium RIFOXYC2_FULL_36_19 TaxID=1801806 RepID=A0A1F6YW97_9BACT|nr:MAG: hypothetical protein UR90_C0009G0010 [Parcubacteria group bacterium GW2011_GWC1_35_8]OGJ06366.1 MAG: hypothetical protein A2238_02650 [Candidatus Nomurabacteria bacterium RIFOXYA2_FULL_35_9]OGJ10652.1 MAG: hypothetical protein A2456_01515 [Candidatus Nomurabacteria bacterium RIFOXYC2_FULL_36_19]HCH59326.1 hypothetical protein [Candidatus Zambryskibacteria bacterium]
MKTFKQDFIQSVKIIILALFIAVGTSYIFAWTAPTSTPPNGDASAPINVGYSPQIKQGNLWIKGLVSAGVSATNGLIVENGRVGIGTTNPYGILGVRPGTNENLMVGPGILVSGAVAISATNDNNTANTPLEVRASKTSFTTGDVCTGTGTSEKCLSAVGISGGVKDEYVICGSSAAYNSWGCRYRVNLLDGGFNCDSGYYLVEMHQNYNGNSYFIDAVKCRQL